MSNYTAYHVHSYLSLLDSCTDYRLYIDKAKELGQTAIAITEHGKPLQWVHKKMYCDEVGIKYIHGVECYLTKALLQPDPQTGEMVKVRDNYHTVLLARDYAGLLEINKAISVSTDEEHTYYSNRITFDEFLRLSNHVITTSACLASPLNKLSMDDPWYERLVKRYDFLEIQAHNSQDQIEFNQRLAFLARKYNKPLIAGTDTHSLDSYKAECRQVLLDHKGQSYGNEDEFDLTYKTYDELVAAFREQDAIPEALWMEAIENTNRMADMVQSFELDTALKYPKLYGSSEADREMMVKTIEEKLTYKLENNIIPRHQEKAFRAAIEEELRVFDKIDMTGYILCMSELITWCWENGIPVGPARGSVGGSRIAYVTDIIDLNPETWNTVFSRFANEDRKEVGDIDVDVIDTDRPKIFKYLIDRFGQAYTARVPTWSTAAGMKAIEIIGKAFSNRWKKQNPGGTDEEDPFHAKKIAVIKKEFEANESAARKKYPDIFHYYDGLLGTPVAQSVHAAGMVVSPLTLADHYGVFWKDGELVMNIDMEEIHEVSLVKFDLLILNNIGIIADTCKMAGIPYPRSHEVNWNDPVVWEDMMRSPVGVFQFEGDYAYKLLKDFKTKSIFDMSLVTACIRPSGASYRTELIARKTHKNPSALIDELLKNNYGYCIAKGSKVWTENGLVSIEDVRAGDIVRTDKGYKHVVAVNHMGAKPVVTIEYGDTTLRCTHDHKILTQDGWKEACKLTEYDSVAYCVGTNSKSDYDIRLLKIVGWLLGDGILTTGRAVGFVNQNIDVMNEFRSSVESLYNELTVSIADRKSRVNKLPLYYGRVKFVQHSKKENRLHAWLRSVGLAFERGGPRAEEKSVPKFVFTLSRESILNLLGAYTDTDSCIWNKVPVLRYKTSSRRLAFDIKELWRLVGCYANVTESGDAYDVCVSNAVRSLQIIYPYSIKVKSYYGDKSALIVQRSHARGFVSAERYELALKEIGVSSKHVMQKANVNMYYAKRISVDSVEKINQYFPTTFAEKILLDDIIWVPVKNVTDGGQVEETYDLSVIDDHCFCCNNIIVHNCVYQEDVIKFLQQICGLSGSEADNVRRAIARKQMDRLEAALPSILEGYCSKSPKPRKEAESEANEFIQILIDASSYMFGYNHSVAYCLVGYLCAWLRCYHPAEFITSYLNHAKNDSDITGGTELAQVYGIKIMPPKFEVSDAFYAYDKETKTIAKGISSIKGYGEAVCHKLHEIGKKRHEYFVDALEELYQSSIKASNIAPLIKVDYFSGYGNSVELSKILELFDMFRPTKVGGKKQVDRKTVNGTALLDMVLRHGTDKTSKGDDAKKLTIIDIQGFMRDMESHMLSLGIKDVDIRVKMQNQHDILGYIDLTTNKKEDRRKLLLTDVVPLKSKKTDDVWGYAVFSQSIGTGKTSRLTLRASTYKQRPIKKGDIIFAQNVKLEDSGYWYLYDYHLIL